MKILAIHADYIEFQAKKKAFKGAEEGVEKGQSQKIEECLVIFTAVEKKDEENITAVMKRYITEIKEIAGKVNVEKIVLYPYAHLSSSLANPKIAEQFMKDAQKRLSSEFELFRAPFGWYKSFNIACKGHPLSELSREFGPEDASENAKLKREHKDEKFEFDKRILSEDEQFNLTGAAIIAKAMKDIYPEAEIGGIGFYHDQFYVDIANVKFRNDEIPRLKKNAKKVIREDLNFTISNDKKLKGLQKDIATDLGNKAVSYSIGDLKLVPIFKKPFLESTKKIGSFKILNIASSYWKGNQNNKQLTRIYGVAFSSQNELKDFENKLEKAEARSHIKLGKELGLFVISDLVGPGLPLLTPKGMILRREIIDYIWSLHRQHNYQWVWTPHIAKEALYKTSGHWDKFGDELFKVIGKSEKFVLKPMNCPHHMQIFDSFSLSYRDLPVRFFEPATIYRDEKSGQLHGLTRVRAITQDDGHIFCRTEQIGKEVSIMVEIIRKFYATIGLDTDYWVSLSVRGEDKSKYLGEDKAWNLAENALEKAAKENKLPYKKIKGEAAFYGPKLDFMFKDSLEREWQLATIQCDFNLPERFNLSFINEKSEKERPVVIHRAISGSLERFMGIIIEHFAGKFPLWLSPVQVKILTVTDRSLEFANKVRKKLFDANVRVNLDDRSETIGKKVRDAQLDKTNYMITIGDKEVEAKTLAVRSREGKVEFGIDVDMFVKRIIKEISERKL